MSSTQTHLLERDPSPGKIYNQGVNKVDAADNSTETVPLVGAGVHINTDFSQHLSKLDSQSNVRPPNATKSHETANVSVTSKKSQKVNILLQLHSNESATDPSDGVDSALIIKGNEAIVGQRNAVRPVYYTQETRTGVRNSASLVQTPKV